MKKRVLGNLLKPFLIVLGWILVILGVIGIIVPLMPTTIFLILAAACFAKSSDKFYNWLMSNKYLGRYIRDYYLYRGMPLRAKIIAIFLLNLTIGYSAFFVVTIPFIKILLLSIAFGVTAHIISLKTLRNKALPVD